MSVKSNVDAFSRVSPVCLPPTVLSVKLNKMETLKMECDPEFE